MLRLLSHTKCDANTTDGINKTTNTKLAQNVFQAKIKTAKALIAREWAVQQNCQPTHTRIQAQAYMYEHKHSHAHTYTYRETNTELAYEPYPKTEPQHFVGYARETHTHTDTVYVYIANLLTELVRRHQLNGVPRAKYECERGSARLWVRARDGIRENSAAVCTVWERATGVRTAHESASAVFVPCCCCRSSCSG